jgi:hypothetical protein
VDSRARDDSGTWKVWISDVSCQGEAVRVLRMTTRRWMILVALVAALAASWVQAQRQIRYASVWRAYRASMEWYQEGRLPPGTLILRSQHVMQAELSFSFGKKQQIRAVAAHLSRASEVIQAEINDLPRLHARPDCDAFEIDEALQKGMLPLQKHLSASDVKAGLATCQDQLKKLKEMR